MFIYCVVVLDISGRESMQVAITCDAVKVVEWRRIHEVDSHERYKYEPHKCHEPNGDC